ncbi:acetyl-CoA acetyltransferase [Variovorax sp. J22P168]|uniref:acetyl-CoA acetyltransferase n=1 Tax=Variovorax jilinensis TaxID=3053513 RepID=UPI0025784B27|nr:acetyl-CoA acetyltransferase [Variovorax sp. J22P168]MDM0014042.1 acetyl-CoA acetyltransferase [Variovorax sp. J22P168]
MTRRNTPVIIGVGQSSDRIDGPDYRAWSASDLAAAAARSAIQDAQAADPQALYSAIEAIATTRTFEDSLPVEPAFGKSSNFPRSIAQRLLIDPRCAVWAKAGGNSPQDLVVEFAGRIAAGEFEVVLITGAEAISTVRHARAKGLALDFAEDPAGAVEDRGPGIEELLDPLTLRHGVDNAPVGYALAENARRARLGLSVEDYAQEMGRLFAPFARIAHGNARAAWPVPAYSAEELAAVDGHNRWIATPYPLHLVARDQVNLGAAVLLASEQAARRLGVAQEKFVYLHGAAKASEKPLLRRADLGASEAARAVVRATLQRADIAVDEVSFFDFYSCFPIAVSNVACDELGLSPEDPRRLTVTGGLPYFGGPGNNYSMHAIAEMVEKLRAQPGARGLIGANGGNLSKYSAGVYSTAPRAWWDFDLESLQRLLDARAEPTVLAGFEGLGTIETCSVQHVRGVPLHAVVVGRTGDGARFIARSREGDDALLRAMMDRDPLGAAIVVTAEGDLNRFVLQS